MLGATIALFIAFFINIFSKISAHAVGMGGLVAMVLISIISFSHGAFTFKLRWVGMVEMSHMCVIGTVIQ